MMQPPHMYTIRLRTTSDNPFLLFLFPLNSIYFVSIFKGLCDLIVGTLDTPRFKMTKRPRRTRQSLHGSYFCCCTKITHSEANSIAFMPTRLNELQFLRLNHLVSFNSTMWVTFVVIVGQRSRLHLFFVYGGYSYLDIHCLLFV